MRRVPASPYIGIMTYEAGARIRTVSTAHTRFLYYTQSAPTAVRHVGIRWAMRISLVHVLTHHGQRIMGACMDSDPGNGPRQQ
jgi:hypothetical protein